MGEYKIFCDSGASQAPPSGVERRLGKQAQSCFLAKGLVGHILKCNKQRTRNVILARASMHAKILQATHSSWVSGHTRVDKTLSRVQSNFWWPGIIADE